MARNQTSAQKRFAQSEKRRLHNKAIKSRCKTAVKHFVKAVQAKDQKEADERFRLMTKELDTARNKGILKLNAVARKKSRMAHLYNVTFTAPTAN
ncbi:MAG: 30S ribosomal protein S20 [Treponema sp.]|nr:30S ribosomal protein S20 [Treponema sp.]